MAWSTLVVCVLFAMFFGFCSVSSMTSAIVNTTYGPVNGSFLSLKTNKTVRKYLGIPFAKAGRFEYPGPPDKWTTTLQANRIAAICPQLGLPAHNRPLMREDCLQVNVYVPGNATSSSALAVMLWIHGGAFIIGDTSIYDGSLLATEGNVIVVTTTYRLGIFGFLSSNSDDLKGNYGTMDQIAAMKWVKQNIARFGGDPNKVTIFGESAGGMSVALLLLSPLASGLYQNLITQSGTAVALASALERDEADLRARSFADALGCEITSLKVCATKKSVQDLLTAQLKASPQPNYLPFAPVVDGFFLPDSPIKLLQAGKFNKSSIIIGVTRDDGTVFVSGAPGVLPPLDLSKGLSRSLFKDLINNRTWVRNQNSQISKILIYQYTDWSDADNPNVVRQRFIDINTDATFKAPAILSAKAFAKKQSATYFYQLETAPRIIPGFPALPSWAGIFHGADIFYTFGMNLLWPENLTTAGEMKLSKDIMRLWTNFAKTGNPNDPISLEKTWPHYTTDRQEYLGLSPNLTIRSKMRPDKMTLWNDLLPNFQETVTPTTASHIPTTTKKPDDRKDKLVMVLAVLTGLFGAFAVILVVALIVTSRKRTRREKTFTVN